MAIADEGVDGRSCAHVLAIGSNDLRLIALGLPRASTLQSLDDMERSLKLIHLRLRERVDLIVAAARRGRFHEVRNLDGEVDGNRRQNIDADIDLTALDLSDVLVLISNELGQLLLRHTAKQSKLPHLPANPLSDLRL
jgi:hypothetical protein